jgi:hypothetical protein
MTESTIPEDDFEVLDNYSNPVDQLTTRQRTALAFAFSAWAENLWDDLGDGGDHDENDLTDWSEVARLLADHSIPLEETGIHSHLDSAVDAIWIALGGTDPTNEEISDVWPELNLDDLAGAALALGIWEKVQAEQGITPGDIEIGGISPKDVQVETPLLSPIDPNAIPMIDRTAKELASLVESHLIEYSEGSEEEGTKMSLGDFGLYLISVAEMNMEEAR